MLTTGREEGTCDCLDSVRNPTTPDLPYLRHLSLTDPNEEWEWDEIYRPDIVEQLTLQAPNLKSFAFHSSGMMPEEVGSDEPAGYAFILGGLKKLEDLHWFCSSGEDFVSYTELDRVSNHSSGSHLRMQFIVQL